MLDFALTFLTLVFVGFEINTRFVIDTGLDKPKNILAMLVAKAKALTISRNDGLIKAFQDNFELLLNRISDAPSFKNLILSKTQKVLDNK